MKLNFIKRTLAVVLAGAMIFTGSSVGDVFAAKDGTKNANSNRYSEDFSTQIIKDNALQMSKVATRNDVDDSYHISLGAYTTGVVETVTEGVPTDIVLVLDQSGSMNYGYTRYNGFTTLNDNGVEVDVTRVDINHNFFQYDNGVKYKWEYVGYDHDNYGFYGVWKKYINNTLVEEVGRYIKWGYNEDIKSLSRGYSVSKMFYSNTRVDALKSTAKAFIESVSQDATDNQVEHRIAIVGFANDSITSDRYPWGPEYGYDANKFHNTFLYSNKEKVNYVDIGDIGDFVIYKNAFISSKSKRDKNFLIDAIDKLKPLGATATDLGFEMAKKIVQNNDDNNRNKIVVFISDGEASSFKNGYESSVDIENRTITKAEAIKKNLSAKIYSISINPAETSKDFMKAVSSGEGCYLEANNSSELNNIFKTISHDISSPGISLVNGELRDIVSDYFQAPEERDITVQTAKFIGGTAENPVFAAPQPLVSPLVSPQIQINGKNIVVKGFDYDSEYLRIVDGKYYGSKLMVSFNVNRVNGFIGGNNVPTNGSASGIYEGNKRIEAFVQPTVNVPLKYDFNTNNGAVYITKNLNDPTALFNQLNYQLNESRVLGNPITNDFAKVTYIIENNGAEVGSYTIAAGANSITLNSNNLNTKELNEDHSYQIKARVEPSQLPLAGETVNDITTGGKQSTIFVYKPTITAKDSTVFLGDTTDMEENILPGITWEASTGAAALETTAIKPNLTFTEYLIEGTPLDIAGTLTPQKMTKLKVKVKAVGDDTRDITAQTKIMSTDSNEGNDYNFKVDVVTGTIIIDKEIPMGSGVEEGNPIFTFKIQSDSHVFYKTIRFGQNVQGIKKAEAITGLPKGIYTITELKTLRYNYATSSVVETNAPTLNDTSNKSVKVAIGQTSEENPGYSAGVIDHMTARSATLRFKNTRESKLGRPTDTDVVTNRFQIGSKVKQIDTANTVQP